VTRVAESAVLSAADVAHYREAGADVVLVGEALVTGDPTARLTEFLSA
jgi:indole-3-glycerol phosphate synthase